MSVRRGRDESYRLSLDDGGHWVAHDRHGNLVGDNIALVRDVCGSVPFSEVVFQLRSSVAQATLATNPLPRLSPRIPPCTPEDVETGRRHLDRLGIWPSVIDRAERSGFLRYMACALIFCGLDKDGCVQNATICPIRDVDPAPMRDLAGTDQRHAQILEGDGASRTVCLVESGVDALSLHTIATRPLPHVIVTGSPAVLGWADDRRVRGLLRHADHVIMVSDRAKLPAAQLATGFQRQVALVRDLSGRDPEIRCLRLDDDSESSEAEGDLESQSPKA